MQQISDLQKYFGQLPYLAKHTLAEFTKLPFDNRFYQNLEILRNKADFFIFDNVAWYQRPMIFCDDVYENAYLWPVVMLVNNIGSFLNFVPENFYNRIIIAPRLETISEILSM